MKQSMSVNTWQEIVIKWLKKTSCYEKKQWCMKFLENLKAFVEVKFGETHANMQSQTID